MVTEKDLPKVSPIVWIYHKRKDLANVTHDDIFQEDLTDAFLSELRSRVKRGNLITVSITGEPTSGKSAVALALKWYVNQYIKEIGNNEHIDEYKTICSDQIEFNRAIMQGFRNVCYSIDEWNELGSTGENSSSEQSVFDFYTDVCAQRYIHRIMCTPKGYNNYDKSATIHLRVLARDDEKKTTLCQISYFDQSELSALPLGTVLIDVAELLTQDWYKRYRKKKMARMDLLDKYGVRDVRALEFSQITLEVFNELRPFAESENTTRALAEMVKLSIRQKIQEKKLMYSIVGRMFLEDPIRALLGADTAIQRLKKKLLKPLPEPELQSICAQIEMLESKRDAMIAIEERNVKVLEEYYHIE